MTNNMNDNINDDISNINYNNNNNIKNNFRLKDKKGILKLNKEIYSKEILIQTTYVLLDKYYFLIDSKDNYWIVEITLKENEENKNNEISEKDINIFLDELIESASYLNQLKKTSKLREILLERAVLSQTIDEDLIELKDKEDIDLDKL